ncbi:MAG: hypothetical protein ACRD0J_08650 [Acidimicrobiales bacterium]
MVTTINPDPKVEVPEPARTLRDIDADLGAVRKVLRGEPRAPERRCARVGRRLAQARESEPYAALAAAKAKIKWHKWRWVPGLKERYERERDLAKARHQEIKARIQVLQQEHAKLQVRVSERAAWRAAHEVDRQQSAELVAGRADRIAALRTSADQEAEGRSWPDDNPEIREGWTRQRVMELARLEKRSGRDVSDPEQRREAEREVEERRLRNRTRNRLQELLDIGREPGRERDEEEQQQQQR